MTPNTTPPRPHVPDLDELSLVIQTPRLVLRPLEQRHADELYPYAADPEVSRRMSWAAHADPRETRAFVDAMITARAAQTELVWAIEREGAAIGCVGLGGIKWTFRAWRIDRAELGYWMGKPFWGQGFMSEAAYAAATWAFETLGLHKVTIGCIEGNVASQRIIEKLGFRFLATFEQDVWRDERWWNHLRYEQTAAEWADGGARTLRFSRPRLP